MFDRKKFSDKLIFLKKAKNVWAKDIAKQIGISSASMSQFENCAISPSVETLCKLAEYFDVPLDYLTGRWGDKQYDSTEELSVYTDNVKNAITFFGKIKNTLYDDSDGYEGAAEQISNIKKSISKILWDALTKRLFTEEALLLAEQWEMLNENESS